MASCQALRRHRREPGRRDALPAVSQPFRAGAAIASRSSGRLALAETELAELAVTRKTLAQLTGQADTPLPADAAPADPTPADTAYQQILAVFATTTDPIRAKDVCLALGLGVTPKDTEKIRAKLKRLTARHILLETEPGLFTPAPETAA